jgi:SAM-dependent methyltransferase
VWSRRQHFVAALADELPFLPATMDIVLSMFVIEHLAFPARFLDEAWRVLRPTGRLLIVAPDFTYHGMASERIGLSYGSGRAKLAKGKIMDALLTAYDTRVRLSWARLVRQQQVRRGECLFPILTEPRCLHLSGFVPDCDAIYPVYPDEIVNYLRQRDEYQSSDVFYRDASTFGLLVAKGTRHLYHG